LIYLEVNILKLKGVVKEVNHPFYSWYQKMDQTRVTFNGTRHQAIGLIHDVSDQCMHFLSFLGVAGLLWG